MMTPFMSPYLAMILQQRRRRVDPVTGQMYSTAMDSPDPADTSAGSDISMSSSMPTMGSGSGRSTAMDSPLSGGGFAGFGMGSSPSPSPFPSPMSTVTQSSTLAANDAKSAADAADMARIKAEKKHATAQGLGALGAALLEGAGRGDFSGSLGRGMAAFTEARDTTMEKTHRDALQAAEERRQVAADRRAEEADVRAKAQEADRAKAAPLARETDQAQLDAFRETQSRGKALREATGKSAIQMSDEITRLAAANPKNETLQLMAKRAIGYSAGAMLGDDGDLNKLASLHADMTSELTKDSDFADVTAKSIERARAEGGAGFGPIAEARRSEQGLGLERQRLDLERHRVDVAAGTRDMVKPAGWADDVRAEVNRDPQMKALDDKLKNVGKPDPNGFTDPKYLAESVRRRKAGEPPLPLPTIQVPQEEIDKVRREAESRAIETVNRRYGMAPTTAHGGSGMGDTPQVDTSIPSQPHANDVRNKIVDGLLGGKTPEQAIQVLKEAATKSGGRIYGYTPEEYLANALRLAHQRGYTQASGASRSF